MQSLKPAERGVLVLDVHGHVGVDLAQRLDEARPEVQVVPAPRPISAGRHWSKVAAPFSQNTSNIRLFACPAATRDTSSAPPP